MIIKRNQEKRKNGKKLSKRIKKQVQGITLIALVVTVIVLLILAGVALNLTVGDNGLFKRAQNAADTYQEASEREAIELALAGMQIGSTQGNDMTKAELENSLKEQFGDEASVENNEDGSFLVTIGENQYYLGEDGEIIDSSNMIEISSANELKAFRDDVNSGNSYEGKYVYLTCNITLDSNENWEPIGLYLMQNSSPDDETNKPFSGIFDGKGYEINGINISTTNTRQGLFGLVNNGKILNLGIGENDNTINCGGGTGAIVGRLYNNSTVKNCYNKANLIVGGYSGGIVGGCQLNSSIVNCYNLGNINPKDSNVSIGGILGEGFDGAFIYNCYNNGNINEDNNVTIDTVGGILGDANGNTILERCINRGKVNGNNSIGGIAGALFENSIIQVKECYNIGEINGQSITGGIVGLNKANVINCYNIGNVGGVNIVGGIIGNNQGNCSNCYNTGLISGTYHIGGVTGQNDGKSVILKNSYSLEGKSEDITGGTWNEATVESSKILSGEQMKNLASTLGAAFDEDTENINQGYPILKWQKN